MSRSKVTQYRLLFLQCRLKSLFPENSSVDVLYLFTVHPLKKATVAAKFSGNKLFVCHMNFIHATLIS